MAIIQEAFNIPADIAIGIATGKLRRIGGVVRIAEGPGKGQIVKMLDPVALKEAPKAAKKALAVAKANKKALIIIGVVVVVVAGGAIIYREVKKQEPKEMKVARARLDDYFTAVRAGKVDFLVVDQLIKALDDLQELHKHKKLTFQLTPEELSKLISHVSKYTQQMAELNKYSCSEEEQKLIDSPRAEVFDLKKYLEIQRHIIVEATEI